MTAALFTVPPHCPQAGERSDRGGTRIQWTTPHGRRSGRDFRSLTVTAQAALSSGSSSKVGVAMVGQMGGFCMPRAGSVTEFSVSGSQDRGSLYQASVAVPLPGTDVFSLQLTSWAPVHGEGGQHRHTLSFLLRRTHLSISPGPLGWGFGYTCSHEEHPANAGTVTARDSQPTGDRF